MARAQADDMSAASSSPLPVATPACRRAHCRGRNVAVFFTLHHRARWPLHSHRVFQVVILSESARGTVTWRGHHGRLVWHPFKGAHVWIVPPGVAHAARLESDAAIVVLLVRARFIRGVTAEPLTLNSFEPLDRYMRADDVVSALGRLFLGYCHEPRKAAKAHVVTAAELLAHHIVAAHVAPREHVRKHPRGLAPSLIVAAKDYFHDHLVEGFDLRELARSLNMSPGHFGRMFRLSTGFTPGDYLSKLRREKAEELLASGRYHSVTEVAHAVGCYDHSHLNKLFRKKYDLPAGVFLRKRQES